MKQGCTAVFLRWALPVLRRANWWAFTGCLVWPRGMTLRARFIPTRHACRMFFRYVTRPLYDWVRLVLETGAQE